MAPKSVSISPEQIASVEKPMWYIATGIWALVICAGLLVALTFGLLNPTDNKDPIRVFDLDSGFGDRITNLPIYPCRGMAEGSSAQCLFVTVTDADVDVGGRVETFSYDR